MSRFPQMRKTGLAEEFVFVHWHFPTLRFCPWGSSLGQARILVICDNLSHINNIRQLI